MGEEIYPSIEFNKGGGYIIKISSKTSIPGKYTSYLAAERAVDKHNGLKKKAKTRAKELTAIRKEKKANA